MDIFDFAGCRNFAQPLRDATQQWQMPDSCLPYFLAQLSIESQSFSRLEENLNYHSETLLRVCNATSTPRNGIKTIDDAAAAVMRGAVGVGEALYGLPWGARLGNVATGDGYKFRGRGLIQITGRSNYEQASHKVYGDSRLLITPELLTLADSAALSACWFYTSRNLVSLTDVVAITHGVNGGEEGLAAREAMTTRLLAYNP